KRSKQRAGGPKMAVPGQRRLVTAPPPRRRRQPAAAAAPPQPSAVVEPAPPVAHADDRATFIGAGVVAAVAFALYALTVQPPVPPPVPPAAGAELLPAAASLGAAPPPGYPLYMLLGHLATQLPGGSPALRMNLLSGLLDAIAVGIVFVVVHRLVASSPTRSR